MHGSNLLCKIIISLEPPPFFLTRKVSTRDCREVSVQIFEWRSTENGGGGETKLKDWKWNTNKLKLISVSSRDKFTFTISSTVPGEFKWRFLSREDKRNSFTYNWNFKLNIEWPRGIPSFLSFSRFVGIIVDLASSSSVDRPIKRLITLVNFKDTRRSFFLYSFDLF